MVEAQKIKDIKSDKYVMHLLLCVAFSLFIFCVSVRTMINQSSLNYSFNLIYIFFALLTIILITILGYLDIGVTLVSFTFLGVALIVLVSVYQRLLTDTLYVISTLFLPFLTTAIRLPELTFKSFLEKFIKAANIVCCSLIVIGIVDYLSGAAIQVFFARHQIFELDQARLVLLEHAAGIYRYYSLLGHPLVNAWYLLAFYALNILYNRYFKALLNEYFITLITLVGLVLCGSRSALLIGIFMFVFLNNRQHKIISACAVSLMSLGLFLTPVFQKNLLQRFIIAQTTGNFSGGRNEALSYVINGYVKPPAFFTGGGLVYSRQITLMMGAFINSFEYPIMMFFYDFGILGTSLIYSIILVIPIIIFLMNKSYFIMIFFILISLYINGFNAIANYTDYMGQFCFFTMIMVNLSYYIKRRQEKSEGKVRY